MPLIVDGEKLTTANRKALFWTTYTAYSPVHDAERELLLREKAAGTKTVGVYCNGALKRCHAQRAAHKDYVECAACDGVYRARIAPLLDEIILLRPEGNVSSFGAGFHSQSSLREFKVDGSDIGTSVLSTLKTDFGDDDPPLDELQNEVAARIESAALVHRAFSKMIEMCKPDIVYFFNGRQFDSRPLLRICQQRRIAFVTYEAASDRAFFTLRHDTTVHDVFHTKCAFQAFRERAQSAGQNNLSALEMIAAGQDIYGHNFRRKQQREALPKGYNPFKKNIVILHSSEDEYSDVDRSLHFWIGSSFPEFLEKLLCELGADNSFQVYVRLHPRLANYKARSVTRLMHLRHPLLEVIPPESRVDTFELAKRATVSICYGSTAGPEAVLLGAAVVCVGECGYASSGMMPEARDLASLRRLISDSGQIKCDPVIAEEYLQFLRAGGEPFRLLDASRRETLQEIRQVNFLGKLRGVLLYLRVPIVKSGVGKLIYATCKWLSASRLGNSGREKFEVGDNCR